MHQHHHSWIRFISILSLIATVYTILSFADFYYTQAMNCAIVDAQSRVNQYAQSFHVVFDDSLGD